MPYDKTPMKKKGSMMYMGHDSAAKMYGSKSAIKMDHDSPMKAGHSPMKAGHSPMKDKGQPMMKHGKGLKMSAELMYNAVDDITQGKGKGDFPFTHKFTSNSASMMVDKSMANMNHKGSAMPMYGPAKMYGKKK
jgi:hypothetical protein